MVADHIAAEKEKLLNGRGLSAAGSKLSSGHR